MSIAPRKRQPNRRRRNKETQLSTNPISIMCARCGGRIVRGQRIAPVVPAKDLIWSVHPVLSKPVVFRGLIPTDGSPACTDLSLGEQLRQRAAMGGEKERAELAAFETLLARMIANALVAQLRTEAAAHDVDVWTWLARETEDEPARNTLKHSAD